MPRVLYLLLIGIAATWALLRTAQAEDIVYVVLGGTVGEYKADGAAIKANFITGLANPPGAGGLLVSGDTLYVTTVDNSVPADVVATYDAGTGALINFHFIEYTAGANYTPRGMVLSGSNLFVANAYEDSIGKFNATSGAGEDNFIYPGEPRPLGYPWAVAVKDNHLFVTNNYGDPTDYYIAEFNATTGKYIKRNFIQIPPTGLYGLAVKDNILYVSIFGGNSGIAQGVAEYNATTGELITPTFVSVNEPWGIAVLGNTLFVASYHDYVIYEFNATTGAQLPYSITLPSAPSAIAVRSVKTP